MSVIEVVFVLRMADPVENRIGQRGIDGEGLIEVGVGLIGVRE